MNAESQGIASANVGHEPAGLNWRFVILGTTGLFALILLTVWSMGGVLRLLSYGAMGHGEGGPMETSARTVGLGLNQAAQREAMDAHQEQWLRDYAWIDQEKQTARIPIARAMKIIAERGFGAGPDFKEEPAAPEAQDPPVPSNEDGQ